MAANSSQNRNVSSYSLYHIFSMLVSTWLSRISIVIISGKSVRIVNYTEVSMQETAKEEGDHPMVYVSDIYIYTL